MKGKSLVAVAFFSLPLAWAHADLPAGADLTGHVTLPEGQSAAATILIRYAQLKTNFESSISTRSPLLPIRARTDRLGNFTFGPLDARWLYFGVVMAPGCKLQPLNQIDPAGGPLDISLETACTNVAPDKVIHGRVIDASGSPVSGALIDIEGTTRNGQATWPAQDRGRPTR